MIFNKHNVNGWNWKKKIKTKIRKKKEWKKNTIQVNSIMWGKIQIKKIN